MIPLIVILGSLFHPDAYVICGKEPLTQCLVTVDACLRDSEAQGYEPDEAFEWCAENVDPNIVHFW